MVGAGKVGRNDPCPCGSGKKYKQCCERTSNRLSPLAWLAIVGAAVAALVAFGLSFNVSPELTNITCPPGQIWDPGHGHCH